MFNSTPLTTPSHPTLNDTASAHSKGYKKIYITPLLAKLVSKNNAKAVRRFEPNRFLESLAAAYPQHPSTRDYNRRTRKVDENLILI